MKLIFAQGNPGNEYLNTRHNLGFLAIDHFAEKHNFPEFNNKSKFQAQTSEINMHGEKIILAKPMTFYNLTGQSARAIVDFYKLTASDILVIHDELSLSFGTIRVRKTGSDAGNKGIRSLNEHIGLSYSRLRVGIQTTVNSSDPSTFVLSKFNSEQLALLEDKILPLTDRLINDFINNQLLETSYNLLPEKPTPDGND